jgi:hypothetical protein
MEASEAVRVAAYLVAYLGEVVIPLSGLVEEFTPFLLRLWRGMLLFRSGCGGG